MAEPKRILFLLHLPPPVHGSSIIGKIIKESSIINNGFESSYLNLLASENVAESGKVGFRKMIGFVFTWFKVLKLILNRYPHACYFALSTTGKALYKDVLLIILLKIFNIKLIYHLHNKGISQHQHKRVYRIFYNYIFKDAKVILLSKFLYPDIQTFVPYSKVYICPNGIKDETSKFEYSNQNRQSNGLDAAQQMTFEKIVQILFLSNLIETKGVFILLKACTLLMKRNIPFKCIFIGAEGDINTSRINREITQLGLKRQVHYLGKKYGGEKSRALLDADIFVLPTYYTKECFPLVLLEAMSYSLPAISTFEGGIPDVIEDKVTGFLVPQKDSIALADKLELLIKNPELRRGMGIAGRKKFEHEFTIEIFEKRLEKILQEVIEK
ncbi:MAG: glycosyltransferase family 4 protein [Ginsengibacter sp.]